MSGSGYSSRVGLYVDDVVMEGLLHVGARSGGHKCRVSDALNDGAQFIVLTDVSVQKRSPVEGTIEPGHYETLIVRKGEIKLVIPRD